MSKNRKKTRVTVWIEEWVMKEVRRMVGFRFLSELFQEALAEYLKNHRETPKPKDELDIFS